MSVLLLSGTAGVLPAQSPASASAQTIAQAIGRWDLTVEGEGRRYPSWLEVTLSGNRTLVGRFVGGGGSARPIARVQLDRGRLRFAIPPQWKPAPKTCAWTPC